MTRLEALRAAEEAFLLACGWAKVGDDAWEEPDLGLSNQEVYEYDDPRVLRFGHAVNSELLHGPERGTCKKTDRDALHAAWEDYLLGSGWTKERATTWDESVVWIAPTEGPSSGYRRPRAMFTKAVHSQKARDNISKALP